MEKTNGNEKTGEQPDANSEMPEPVHGMNSVQSNQVQPALGNVYSTSIPTATTKSNVQHEAVPATATVEPNEVKHLFKAYLMWLPPSGLLGFHQFYLRRYFFGFLYMFTLGIFGISWLLDAVRMFWLVRDANRRVEEAKQKQKQGAFSDDDENDELSLLDAYILWFPLGLFGLHHYYMGRTKLGIVYTFTGGLFGVGWLIDAFRMPCLVAKANAQLKLQRQTQAKKVLSVAYLYGATPAGFFGAHHFYLGRRVFGIYYMLTLGGLLFGWIFDLFRMRFLVERANHPEKQLLGARRKHLDDAYVLAIPFGFLGLHHFYLEKPRLGMVYLFTGGLFGIGWLIDIFRMPLLVAMTNKKLEECARRTNEVSQRVGDNRDCIIVTDTSKVAAYPVNCQPQVIPYPPSKTPTGLDPATLMYNTGPYTITYQSFTSPPPYTEGSWNAETNDQYQRRGLRLPGPRLAIIRRLTHN